MPIFSGSGVQPSLHGAPTNVVELQAGQAWIIQPAGWYMMALGKYTILQQLDPITQLWRPIGGGAPAGGMEYAYVDGVNYRLANQSGCAVGALLTNAGSSYTSAPTVTSSTGGSLWKAIMGQVVNTSVTVSNGGSNYTYPPLVEFSAPPAGGIQATGYCTLSANAVSTVTVVDQGAGYTTPPTVTFTNDPREGLNGLSVGSGAQAVATLTGSGTVNAVVCIDHGNPVTSLPTLSFSGGGGSSAAATTIMNWAITSYTVSNGGAGLSGAFCWVTAEDKFPTTAAAYTNVTTQKNLVQIRKADIKGVISSNAITATGAVVYDGGCYTASPEPLVLTNASVVTTAPVVTFALGGQNDVSYITPL